MLNLNTLNYLRRIFRPCNRLKEVPEALLGMRQLLRLSLDSNPLPEHVQEVGASLPLSISWLHSIRAYADPVSACVSCR